MKCFKGATFGPVIPQEKSFFPRLYNPESDLLQTWMLGSKTDRKVLLRFRGIWRGGPVNTVNTHINKAWFCALRGTTDFILLPRTRDVSVRLITNTRIRVEIDVGKLQLHQLTSLQSLSLYSQVLINKSSHLEISYLFIQLLCFEVAIVSAASCSYL